MISTLGDPAGNGKGTGLASAPGEGASTGGAVLASSAVLEPPPGWSATP